MCRLKVVGKPVSSHLIPSIYSSRGSSVVATRREVAQHLRDDFVYLLVNFVGFPVGMHSLHALSPPEEIARPRLGHVDRQRVVAKVADPIRRQSPAEVV